MKGLFINNKKAKDSIYESGFMAYQCLLLSSRYSLDYIEVDIDNRSIPLGYDFYFFNYHIVTMQWLDTKKLKKELGFCVTMILEVAPNDPFVYCSPKHFAAYCVLDPTVKIKNTRVYPFPRPLEKYDLELPVTGNAIPVIGTFGFATKGKGFQHVVEAVNKEFDQAIVRINIPYGDFVPNSKEYAQFLADVCRQRAKEGITVEVTHDFMSKEDLIKWCASNTLNCFLYDRNMPGLAATTDQAIVSGRPLSVSDNDTFRHITHYLPPYPSFSLKDSIEKSVPLVNKMKVNWAPASFVKLFEALLAANKKEMQDRRVQTKELHYLLPVKKTSPMDIIEHRYKKYRRKFKSLTLKALFSRYDSKYSKEII